MDILNFKNLFKPRTWTILLKIFIPAILFFSAMIIFAITAEVDFSSMSRDPVQYFNGKPYMGVISSAGIILWCFCTAFLFYSYALSKKLKKERQLSLFFLYASLLTTWLLIDDFFMIHDLVVNLYLPTIVEKFLYLAYGGAVLIMVYQYKKIIMESDYLLFLMSFGFLGMSIIVDYAMAKGIEIPRPFMVEDGFKFLGIVSWFAYFVRTGNRYILNQL